MKTLTQTQFTKMAKQKYIAYEHLCNFFSYYPIELIEKNIYQLFENTLPQHTESALTCSQYIFYKELDKAIKDCHKFTTKPDISESLLPETPSLPLFLAIRLIQELIPTAYIFSDQVSKTNISLFIVLDQFTYRPVEEVQSALDLVLLGHPYLKCTIIAYCSIYEQLKAGDLFYSALCLPDNCIYQATEKYDLPLLNNEKQAEIIHYAQTDFHTYMQKAKAFRQSAEQFINECNGSVSLFMLQQACEFTFHGLLTAFRKKKIKSHNLSLLQKYLSNFIPEITGALNPDPEQEKGILESLSNAYSRSRYDTSFCLTADKLAAYIDATGKLIERAIWLFKKQCEKLSAINTI